MSPEKSRPSLEPNIFLTDKCGRKCVFCSAKGEDRLMSAAQVRSVLAAGHRSLVFEGGEPLLSRRLEYWVRAAARAGVRDITVLTNGLPLTSSRRDRLMRAGISHFHFNFPSHLEKLHDLLTGTKGRFQKQVSVIRETAALGPGAASLVCVINSLNYRHLPAYIKYAARELPGIFYVALNFIKVKGLVKKRAWLVPELRAVRPFLLEALRLGRRLGVPCLVDGVPLCTLKGFEAYSRDGDRLLKGDDTYLGEKKRVRACAGCGFSRVCAGPRADYLTLHGERGLRAAPPGAARAVAARIRRGQLSLNKPRKARK